MTLPWNTMTGRFIVLLMTALVTAAACALFIIEMNFDMLVARSIKSTQLINATTVLRQIEVSEKDEIDPGRLAENTTLIAAWTSDDPIGLSGSVRDLDTEERLQRALSLEPGDPVRAWTLSSRLWADSELPAGADISEFPTIVGLLHVAVNLENGSWVNIIVRPRPQFSPLSPSVFMPLVFSLILVTVSAIYAARLIAHPFRSLTKSAERLANGESHEPLDIVGPVDVRRAQAAFNLMASRLQTTLHSQRTLLAAIGHDLRTPITSLRVRTEMLADGEERDRMIRALDELQQLTEAALNAASVGSPQESSERIDARCLIQATCDDLADLGCDITFDESEEQPVLQGRADELSRAIRNLIENAAHYGGQARVRLSSTTEECRIVIIDDGPGIPEMEQERVFEPFVRLERSRSKETGGHGLGLYIAANAIAAHGGKIELRNLTPRGLQVTISLPLAGGAI